MSNQVPDVRKQIEQTRATLAILEEIDELDTEFRLIETEYLQRRKALSDKLTADKAS
jgi:hypothetical protein